MPRSVRIEFPGAVYHVMCRGDRREPIFVDDDDRTVMIETLAQTCSRTGFRIHGFVLMPNHYHLLLETPEANLVAGMKWFQGTYTQRYNRRHRQCGHLFQGRYKAVPVEAEDASQFKTVSDYIHLNPARARLLDTSNPDLARFAWSSFPEFSGGGPLPEWLVRARVFASNGLPDEGRGSCRRYSALMALRVREVLALSESNETVEEWKRLRRGWYLGSDRFRDRLMDKADALLRGKKRASYRDDGMKMHDEREAGRLLQRALDILNVSLPSVWAMRQTDVVKQAIAWWLKSRTVVGDAWLCEKLEMGSRTNISRAVAAYRGCADKQRKQLKEKLYACAD